ncbi:MAG: cupredoxin domain-containing protein [Jatrophihabitantaceae bacterium]
MPAPPRIVWSTVLVGCVIVVLVSCSNTQASVNRRPHHGASTAALVDGVQQVTVRTGDTYRFDPSTITVHAGRVRVVLVNDGKGAPHNWTLTGLPGAATSLVSAGETRVATFIAPAPGSYGFVCTIHRKQGQTGMLVVLTS